MDFQLPNQSSAELIPFDNGTKACHPNQVNFYPRAAIYTVGELNVMAFSVFIEFKEYVVDRISTMRGRKTLHTLFQSWDVPIY